MDRSHFVIYERQLAYLSTHFKNRSTRTETCSTEGRTGEREIESRLATGSFKVSCRQLVTYDRQIDGRYERQSKSWAREKQDQGGRGSAPKDTQPTLGPPPPQCPGSSIWTIERKTLGVEAAEW